MAQLGQSARIHKAFTEAWIPPALRAGITGEHRPDGFALVLGRAVKDGGLPPLAHNADFPRFVSHLLGVRTAS